MHIYSDIYSLLDYKYLSCGSALINGLHPISDYQLSASSTFTTDYRCQVTYSRLLSVGDSLSWCASASESTAGHWIQVR